MEVRPSAPMRGSAPWRPGFEQRRVGRRRSAGRCGRAVQRRPSASGGGSGAGSGGGDGRGAAGARRRRRRRRAARAAAAAAGAAARQRVAGARCGAAPRCRGRPPAGAEPGERRLPRPERAASRRRVSPQRPSQTRQAARPRPDRPAHRQPGSAGRGRASALRRARCGGSAPRPGCAAAAAACCSWWSVSGLVGSKAGAPSAGARTTRSTRPAGRFSGGSGGGGLLLRCCAAASSLRSARRRSASRSRAAAAGSAPRASRSTSMSGSMPGRLDGAARRRVVARRGQADRAVARDRHHGLHAALAEGLGAHDDGAAMVLQRAGDDLADALAEPPLISTTIGRPCAMSPDSAFQRCASSLRRARVRDDLALVEEVVRDLHRLVEQPARVVAQVEDDALEVAARPAGACVLHGAAQPGLGLLVEGGEADIADVAALQRGSAPPAGGSRRGSGRSRSGARAPSRRMVRRMAVPRSPRICSTASCSVRPCTELPLRWVIRSPGCTPARAAGRVVDRAR